MPLKFVKSQRSQNLLLYEDSDTRNGNIIGTIPTHDHSGSIVAVQVKIANKKIKKKAVKSNDKPVDVVASSLRGVLSPVAANLPKMLSLTRAVQRARRNNPDVYLIAPNKTKTTYVNFLKILRDRIPNYQPQRLMVDFEHAFIEAFKEVYSGVQINGCNFHFTKCVWKHVQKYDHQKKYNEDIKFSMNVRLLMGLAFVPSEDVIAAFEEIVSSEYYDLNSDCFEELLEYFELTWIGKVKHNKNKRDKPMFPIKLWNCQTAVIHDYLRSNNPCEGWNSGFNKRVGQAHPVMEELVKSLKDEQVKTDVLMTQIESGLDVTNTRLKAYRNYTERLKSVVLNYDANKKYEYLNNVAKI
ncbi:uncharacterized protein LOC128668046 [Microplitis demolitor]|uniref:uncharacterized protein LOC128668046 n=1 Tax=Microplitis demolitor TaxID=69319 RepID=UPI00235B6C67|nr:uncharacterized protein LOC128668046 [Microplitis demolitor]